MKLVHSRELGDGRACVTLCEFVAHLTTAWVRAAFSELRLDRLRALVHPENVASIRVLAKSRFREEGRDTIMGMNSMLFLLDAEAHLT